VRRALFSAFVVLMTACASGRVPHIPGDPPPAVNDADAERDYQAVLEKFTSEQGVYDNLDTKLFFRATWQSPTFSAARVKREGLFKAWPNAELEKKQSEEKTRLADATEFFFAVHANDYRFDDFERPNSMWRFVMVVGDEELAPISVERLGRTNVEMRSYYSYMESFWVGYRVRFPKKTFNPGDRFRLKLASALGHAELPYTAD
jgi:hypothetical protein